jgi:simple sugar transport system permease protein
MKLRIRPRLATSRRLSIGVTIGSAVLAFPLIAGIFFFYGINPLLAFQRIWYGALGNPYSLSETITKSIPLILCAIGLSVAFETMFYNIGAEGQLLVGAICGTWMALAFPTWPAYLLIPAMFTMGFVGGALWGLGPSILKVRFGTNEVITTLMMNYIASKILEFLVYGPWRGKEEWGFPYTSKFSASAQIPTIGTTRIHYPTLLIAIFAALFIYVLIRWTKHGFEIRIVGKNPEAARYLGIDYWKAIIIVMIISGGLAGIAGVGEVGGIQHRLRVGISPGYGFTAIIVAWLGRLHPFSTVLTALFFGGLLVGGEMIQISLGLPFGTIQIFNGIFLLSVLCGDFFLKNEITIVRENVKEGGS